VSRFRVVLKNGIDAADIGLRCAITILDRYHITIFESAGDCPRAEASTIIEVSGDGRLANLRS
jgi:hypothetical protein